MESNLVRNHMSVNNIGWPCSRSPICLVTSMINNSNRTEWSPLQCVIIQEINKMGWPHTSIWLKTELDDTKFCYQLIMTITKFVMFQAFQNQNIGNFFNSKKKSHLSALVWWHVLSNYLGMTCSVLLHFLLVLKSGKLIANQIWQFC